jgi:hypothetical protein
MEFVNDLTPLLRAWSVLIRLSEVLWHVTCTYLMVNADIENLL